MSNKFKWLLLFFFGGFLSCPLISCGQDNAVIQLGDQRELFVDHYLIDTIIHGQLIIHHPHDEGSVLSFDQPWEGPFCNYITIMEDGNLFRAYYRGSPGGKDGSNSEVTCMAESLDGVHWIKPKLGIYHIDGSLDNNVTLAHEAPSSHNFSPFIDQNPATRQEQKYKALALGKGGLVAYASKDGIHWKKMQDKPVITKGAFDSQNVAFWSVSEGYYVCYFRTWTKGNFKGFRTVSRTISHDFIHWSEPVEMTYGNTPPENIYVQQTSPYYRAPQIYLAIGARFMQGRQVVSNEEAKQLHVNPDYYKDCSDVVLMSTRGGNDYHRTFMEAFIRPGIGLDNWVSRSNYPALNVIQTSPEEISIYLDEDYAQPTAHLERYSLRIDGFTSTHSPYSGGEVVTKPFIFTGKALEINYSTSAAGEIRVEIEDKDGNPVPGYAMKMSGPVIGNEIKRVVSWDGNTDVSPLAGKVIRLHFYMKDADLYSFKFNKE
jgi:hypothetical protein